MGRAVLLNLEQTISVSQQLGGKEQESEVLLPGLRVWQDCKALGISAAVGVVLHQSNWVQQPHVSTGLPTKPNGDAEADGSSS